MWLVCETVSSQFNPSFTSVIDKILNVYQMQVEVRLYEADVKCYDWFVKISLLAKYDYLNRTSSAIKSTVTEQLTLVIIVVAIVHVKKKPFKT